MAQKGLDAAFVHYGIRRNDLDILESLATGHNLDFDWIREQILRKYHELKTRDEDVDMRAVESIVAKSLDKLEAPCK